MKTDLLSRVQAFVGRYVTTKKKSRAFPFLLTGDTGADFPIRSAYQAGVVAIAEAEGKATIYVTEDFQGTDQFAQLAKLIEAAGWSVAIQTETSAMVRTKYGTGNSFEGYGLDTHKSSNTAVFEGLVASAIARRAREIRFHVRAEHCGIVHNIDGSVYPAPSISAALGHELCANAYTNLADKTSFEPGKGTFSISIDQSCTIDMVIAGGLYRLRYQSLPEADGGYDVTMRIQPQGQAGMVPTLEQLGFTPSAVRLLKRAANSAKGAVYATGPVGQGKTTTLYALMYKPKEERNKYVLTFEDPVEYRQFGVTRVPVGKIGYENGVKRALRMGAHVVLIGEIRDEKMGGMAKALSETSTKVFTSLHVNGANNCVDRLTGEEIRMPRQVLCDPDMVAAFFYQRLMPKLCDCALPATRTLLGDEMSDELTRLEIPMTKIRVRNKAGCSHADGSPKCNEGRLGGIPVVEIIEPDAQYMRFMRRSEDAEAKEYWLSTCKSHITEEDVHGKPIIANALYHVAQGTLDVFDVEATLGLISKYTPSFKGNSSNVTSLLAKAG